MKNRGIHINTDGYIGIGEIVATARDIASRIQQALKRPRSSMKSGWRVACAFLGRVWRRVSPAAFIQSLKSVRSALKNVGAKREMRRTLSVASVLWFAWASIALATDWIDPFGLSSNSDELALATLARISAPLYESENPAPAVILISNRTLSDAGLTWPAPYSFYMNLFIALARAQPSSVFVDGKIVDGRGSETLRTAVHGAMRRLFQTFDFPVFLADFPAPGKHFMGDLPNVSRLPVLWNIRAGDYPLYNTQPLAGATASHPKWHASPAVAQYQALCGSPGAPECDTQLLTAGWHRPLLLTWGESVRAAWLDHALVDPDDRAHCRLVDPTPSERLLAVVDTALAFVWGRSREAMRARCSHIEYYPAQTIVPFGDMTDEVLNAIQGRPVLIGFDISGMGDVTHSPVSGQLPGVFAHAAALDNLVLYGGGYPSFNANSGLRLAYWMVAGFVLAVVVAACQRGGTHRGTLFMATGATILLASLGSALLFGHLLVDWPFLMLFISAVLFFLRQRNRNQKNIEGGY